MGRGLNRAISFALASLCPVTLLAQSHVKRLRECRAAVSAFYIWYVPLTKNLDRTTFPIALHERASAFSPLLLHALRDDANAQSKATGEIVGIDFDPFLGSQDPVEHYAVRNVRIEGNNCFVDIWPVQAGDPLEHARLPDAVAVLSQRDEGWRFENFLYPATQGDLTRTLALLRRQRAQIHAGASASADRK